MIILCLLDGSFNVGREQTVTFPELSDKLDDAFMANFPDVDFDAAEIEDNVGKETFFDDGKVL